MYTALAAVLEDAHDQAAHGKGKERHVTTDIPFEDQLICYIERKGLSFCEGQAVKKIFESATLRQKGRAADGEADRLGAINYIAASILVNRERS